MIEIYNFCSYLLDLLSSLGNIVIDFLFRDFFGFPLVYYMFGGGLIAYLTAKIILELIT